MTYARAPRQLTAKQRCVFGYYPASLRLLSSYRVHGPARHTWWGHRSVSCWADFQWFFWRSLYTDTDLDEGALDTEAAEVLDTDAEVPNTDAE